MNHRREILRHLKILASRASYPGLLRFEAALREAATPFPDLPNSGEVTKLRAELLAGHLRSVRYVEEQKATRPSGRGEESEPAILLDPLMPGTGSPGKAPPNDRIVLALVRGVLYGLKQSNGEVKWALRVGIDTTTLPVRVPARAGSQERILVLSSDTKQLTALDLDGNALWRYQLNGAVLGRPIVVDHRAYLATYDGEVHEIELNEGKRLGRFLLGNDGSRQRLTRGGTLEQGTRRAYFPADDGCVYILDLGKRRCESILYSRHPAGSLRSELIVVPAEGEESFGFLIFNQADGLDRVRLRVFELPIKDSMAAEQRINPEPGLQGWTWFQPHHDADKLVLLSDRGFLGLFGIRQPGTRDQALFPLLPGGLGLSAHLWPGSNKPPEVRGRAEVVQVQDRELWALAAGRLVRLRLAWSDDTGPRLAPAWDKPISVGSPIHASQVVEDRNGKVRLVLVTQPDQQSCAWVTCVDDDSGRLLWRRQLGAVCLREPVQIPVPGGAPVWMACDQGGALFSLDPTRYMPQRGSQWLSDSRQAFVAGSLPENPDHPPIVLPTTDGQSAYVLIFSGDSRQMLVRQVTLAGGRRLQVEEKSVRLTFPLAGKPVLLNNLLILPLEDGSLHRLPIPLKDDGLEPEGGPSWRADRSAPDSICHMVGLEKGRFVASDGGRGLNSWSWPAGAEFSLLPADRGITPTLKMENRVTGIARLPGAPNEKRGARLAVSDSAGVLTLIEVQDNGDLLVKRKWNLGGSITSPPMVFEQGGVRIGCILDRSRLTFIDPNAPAPLWSYTTRDKDGIVGTPQLVAGMLVVTDQSGFYAGLEPKTGKLLGGYQLSGSIAPAAAAVAFQPGRLLAPLSDGTFLLVPMERLRK